MAAAGMPGTVSCHTREGSIALAPICLSANGAVKGTRCPASQQICEGQLPKMAGRRDEKKEVITILIKMYRAHI